MSVYRAWRALRHILLETQIDPKFPGRKAGKTNLSLLLETSTEPSRWSRSKSQLNPKLSGRSIDPESQPIPAAGNLHGTTTMVEIKKSIESKIVWSAERPEMPTNPCCWKPPRNHHDDRGQEVNELARGGRSERPAPRIPFLTPPDDSGPMTSDDIHGPAQTGPDWTARTTEGTAS